ncbi:hypothetical protein HYY75_07385 [bacterium]|nr:hypothetical protein [bacterium]
MTKRSFSPIIIIQILFSLFSQVGLGASFTFIIPSEPPDTTITANSMHLQGGVIVLEGNVRGVRVSDILTCQKAFINKNKGWILASNTPRLFRKESDPEKQIIRESTLDALNIYWNNNDKRISASPAVTLKIEERSWDLATYSWVIISSDSMDGFQDSSELRFSGRVRIKDKDHFGQGESLDYYKASSTVILEGNAQVEMEEWSQKENKMIKKVITGQRINYNLDSKESSSE